MKKINQEESEVVMDKQKLIRKQFSKWRERRKPQYYEELEKRITEYFKFCEEVGITPAIESCSLCIGISRTTFFRWRQGKGCSQVWQQAIERAYQTILAAVETDGIAGNIMPITMIWLQKNYGYKDGVSLEEQANQGSLYEDRSYLLPSDILAKYTLPEPKESISEHLSASRSEDKDTPLWLLEDSDEPENFDWMPPIIE